MALNQFFIEYQFSSQTWNMPDFFSCLRVFSARITYAITVDISPADKPVGQGAVYQAPWRL
jgi:hypothetical protein